jgi:RHS repeat-associated protein
MPNRPDLLARRYVYAHGVPVAVIDYPQGQALRAESDQTNGSVARAVSLAYALADTVTGRAPRVAYVHANEIGTPVAVTDAARKVVWRAQYRVYGEANVVNAVASPISPRVTYALNLRLPGQYWDAETGWHDNYLRTYDPMRGQYLEPDPLGPVAVTQPFSYVNHNPLIYTDPLGLILFAFDGTGNDETDALTLSNVVHFRNLYRSDDSRVHYMTGPGTLDPQSGIQNPWWRGGNLADAGLSFTGLDRVAYMVRYFRQEAERADDATPMDIDIIGFSRGAAQARDFANQIVHNTRNGWYSYTDVDSGEVRCQRVNFRFMGLWDTVLSTHTGTYNLSIPNEFGHVSHAVALNEYRGRTLRDVPGSYGAFPLESIQGRATPDGTIRVERGFLGSHSDIGGGFEQGGLSRVTLVWMIDQARAAGVQMAQDASLLNVSRNPALHDKSDSLMTGGQPTAQLEDRQVRFADGTTTTQRAMTGTTMTYTDTQRFVTYLADRGRSDFVTGTVDMRGYLEWLNDNGYGIGLTAQ